MQKGRLARPSCRKTAAAPARHERPATVLSEDLPLSLVTVFRERSCAGYRLIPPMRPIQRRSVLILEAALCRLQSEVADLKSMQGMTPDRDRPRPAMRHVSEKRWRVSSKPKLTSTSGCGFAR